MCKCVAIKKVVFGLLLLLNAFVWPKWLGIDGWVAWLALLMVIFGAIMAFCPKCGCKDDKGCEPAKKPAAKKRRKR